MLVAIKEKDKICVGATIADDAINMSSSDMLLDENVNAWEISDLDGWYMVCSRYNPAMDLLRYNRGLFAQEITYQSIILHTIPKIKQILGERGLIRGKCWYNELLIVNKEKGFLIDSYFCLNELYDFCAEGSRVEVARGSLACTKNLSAKIRICEAFQAMESARGIRYFPVMFWDLSSGKREDWYSYEDTFKKMQDDRSDEMDELYKKALQIVIDEQKASMSLLQRKLGIGFYKAGMLIERMEEENYIEEFKGGSSRKVLITQAQFDERFHG